MTSCKKYKVGREATFIAAKMSISALGPIIILLTSYNFIVFCLRSQKMYSKQLFIHDLPQVFNLFFSFKQSLVSLEHSRVSFYIITKCWVQLLRNAMNLFLCAAQLSFYARYRVMDAQ